MGMREEVLKSYNMLKDAGFKVEDIVFEGAMSVKDKGILDKIEALSDGRSAYGNVRILYSVDKDQTRNIIIPVGKPIPEAEGQEEYEEDIGF